MDNTEVMISRKEFQALIKEVAEMRTAFIGIDGQSGFRGDLVELKSDVKDLNRNMNDIIASLNAFKDAQLNNHKLFATKAEVTNVEHATILRLNEFDRKRDEIRKNDIIIAEEKARQIKEMAIKDDEIGLKKKDFVIAKIALVLSVLGMLISSFFTILKFFF